jgi:hypothetical protein
MDNKQYLAIMNMLKLIIMGCMFYFMHVLLIVVLGTTGWTAGIRFQAGATFSYLHSVQTGSGAHRASYPMGTGGDFPGLDRPGRQENHSPPFSAEVKNCGVHHHSSICLHDIVLN